MMAFTSKKYSFAWAFFHASSLPATVTLSPSLGLRPASEGTNSRSSSDGPVAPELNGSGASTSHSRTYPSPSSLPASAAAGCGAPGPSSLMLAANLVGSFLNASGHMSQQNPTALPSKSRIGFFASTSLPLTGHLRLTGLAPAGAATTTAVPGGGATVRSSPRLTFTVGSDFFSAAAPSGVT